MAHIILLILKIAGTLLLSLLGIVLLAVGTILFVPVTYRVHAVKDKAVRVHAAAGWMFRMLSVHFRLEGEKKDLEIRVFGFPVYRPWAEKEKRPKKKRNTRRKKNPEPEAAPPEEIFPEQEPTASASPEDTDFPEQEEEPIERRGRGEGERKYGFFRKAAFAIRRFCDKIKHIWDAIRRIPRSVRSLLERKDRLVEFWDLEEHRNARAALWKEFLYLRDKIRPKKIRGYLHFGFEDPSMTGICMGAASILYAWYPDQFELRPDFDRKILEGDLFFRGSLRLYVLILIALRIWFNRDIRRMYENWQKL